MTITLPPQGSHFEDGVRTGPTFNSVFANSTNVFMPPAQTATPADTQAPGVYTTPMSLLDIIPTPVSTTLLANAATTAGAGYVTLVQASAYGLTYLASYGGVQGKNGTGVLQLDCARNISITSTANLSAANVTVWGWDIYGIPMTEQITGPNNTTVYGKKAFYIIQNVYINAAAANISVGVGNVFGLPYYAKNANYVGVPMWNNVPDFATITSSLVAGTTSAPLAADPLTTGPAGTDIVIVTVASTAGLTNGMFVTIAGAADTDGITAAQLNITAPIAGIVSNTSFSYHTLGKCTTGGTAGGGAAVTITPNTYQGTASIGTLVVADETNPATATTGDVRGTYAPTSNADGTKRLTINMYSASGDTRKYNAALGTSALLPNNPLTTGNTVATITVNAPGHNLTQGETITISGGTGTINGITAANYNITATATIVDQNTFTYTANATSGGAPASGGGALVQLSPYPGNWYQTVNSRYGINQYSVALF